MENFVAKFNGVEIVPANKNFTHHSATLRQQFLCQLVAGSGLRKLQINFLDFLIFSAQQEATTLFTPRLIL